MCLICNDPYAVFRFFQCRMGRNTAQKGKPATVSQRSHCSMTQCCDTGSPRALKFSESFSQSKSRELMSTEKNCLT